MKGWRIIEKVVIYDVCLAIRLFPDEVNNIIYVKATRKQLSLTFHTKTDINIVKYGHAVMPKLMLNE